MSATLTDKFQTRDELVQFIETQTATAVEKAAPYHAGRADRRVPWVTAGPVGRDSAGYSVLKAAAFALGYVGADQAKEEVHTHRQLLDLYAGYGFLSYESQPLPTKHLSAAEVLKFRDEAWQKYFSHPPYLDLVERRFGAEQRRNVSAMARIKLRRKLLGD